jgi:hypothetical protein
VAEDDPVTAPLVEKRDCLAMWYADDRRVVCYPCNNNTTLNFVLIHPDSESHATQSDGKHPRRLQFDSMLRSSRMEQTWLNRAGLEDIQRLRSFFEGIDQKS